MADHQPHPHLSDSEPPNLKSVGSESCFGQQRVKINKTQSYQVEYQLLHVEIQQT